MKSAEGVRPDPRDKPTGVLLFGLSRIFGKVQETHGTVSLPLTETDRLLRERSSMDSQSVSMFVSHKVANHERAARRIKQILEARTERLIIHICEEIEAGDSFRSWISTQITDARAMLALLPPGATRDTTWMSYEIGAFQSHPNGRLLVFKHADDPIPSTINEIEIINAERSDIRDKFLEPLLTRDNFIGDIRALNNRICHADLDRDADEIEEGFNGVLPTNSEIVGAALTVELIQPTSDNIDKAGITASPDFSEILDWRLSASATWKDLKVHALLEKGKGTFWAQELEDLMAGVAREESVRRILTSTFRGRGPDSVGKIFRPSLNRVDYIDNKPVRFYFTFHEVLVPELVRPKGPLGDVTDLLFVAIRLRWEVLYPFLLKRLEAEGSPDKWQMNEQERGKLIGNVIGSLRTIELQVERHHMYDAAVAAFPQTTWDELVLMLEERQQIVAAIEAAGQQNDFLGVIKELQRAVGFNCRVMPLLSRRFCELMEEDTVRISNVATWQGPAAKAAP
jgi:hypothetical protein